MSDPARVLRVFISSTFRDMQGEREELVKRVFPEIRRRCEERGVVWGEVDLRWGVTDEQKAEDAVLAICLAEIERTRPYFIGMLGQRYGWVPDGIADDLALREAWLVDDRGRSVTELEILHGVLNDPTMAGHAYFYLRDPAWVEGLPEVERAVYLEGSDEGVRRLADLRQRVRESGFPVREYPEPRRIGDRVRADLLALVDRLFPEGSAPGPFEQARLDQGAYAARLVANTLERRADLVAVDVAVDAEGQGVVVSGAPGAGVSTLLAGYAARRRSAHPDELVIAHAVDAQRGEASEQSLIEVAGGGVSWVPTNPPATLRIVAGTRPGASLGWLVQRGHTRVDLQLLDGAQREAAATAFLAAFSKALDHPLLDRVAGSGMLANPRHLRTVLDELRQHGDHFTLGELLDRLLAPADLAGLVEVVLDRYEADYELDRPGLVGTVFGAVASSRGGLTEAELMELLGDGSRRPLSQLQLAAGALLPDIGGRLRAGFDELRGAVERRYLQAPADVHRRLAGLFAAEPASPRALEELPWHLLAAGDHDALLRLLVADTWIEAAHAYDAALLGRLWTRLEQASPYRAAPAYASFLSAPTSRAASIVTPVVAALGGAAEALALRQAAVATLGLEDSKGNLPSALVNLAVAQMAVDDLASAVATLDELERCVDARASPELRVALYQNRGVVRRHLGDRERGLADLEQAERIARDAGRAIDVQAAAGERAGVLVELGRVQEALAASAVQVEAATTSGDPSARMRALVTRANLLLQTGEIAGAAKATAEGEHIARDLGDLEWLASALTLHVGLRQWENLLDLARDQLTELIALRERLGQTDVATQLRSLLAAVPTAPLQDDLARLRDLEQQSLQLQGRGDYNGSIAVCVKIEQIARRSGNDRGLASALGNRAVNLYYLGRNEEALPLITEQVTLQRKIADPVALATALANLGELSGRLGRREEGLKLLAEAEQLARGAGQAQFAGQIAQLAEQIRRS